MQILFLERSQVFQRGLKSFLNPTHGLFALMKRGHHHNKAENAENVEAVERLIIGTRETTTTAVAAVTLPNVPQMSCADMLNEGQNTTRTAETLFNWRSIDHWVR